MLSTVIAKINYHFFLPIVPSQPSLLTFLLFVIPGFVHLLKVYVGGINKGTIPPIITAIENVKSKQCKIATEKAVDLYKQILQSSLEDCFPADTEELVSLHKSAYDAVLEQYREQAMIDVKSAEELQVSYHLYYC